MMRSLASSFSEFAESHAPPPPPLSLRAMRRFYIYFYLRCCNTSLNTQNGGLVHLLMKGGLAWLGILWDRRGELR